MADLALNTLDILAWRTTTVLLNYAVVLFTNTDLPLEFIQHDKDMNLKWIIMIIWTDLDSDRAENRNNY